MLMLSTLTNVFAVHDGHYNLACVAGVERVGREKVECEREARSLGSLRSRRASRSHSTFPSLPFVRRPRRLITTRSAITRLPGHYQSK